MDNQSEVLDVLDPYSGVKTGKQVTRVNAHINGDWHGCFHVWFVKNGKDPLIYIQKRSGNKDLSAGFLDVTVGGHYLTGESIYDGVREVQEELNLSIQFADLIPIGRRVSLYKEEEKLNNELVDVFLYEINQDISDIQFDREEVSALLEVPFKEIYCMFTNEDYSYEAYGRQVGLLGYDNVMMKVSKKDFIPSIDLYPYRMAIQVERYFEEKKNLFL